LAASENYPPYLVQKSGKAAAPLILSSPHSGAFYPERLFHLSDLKVEDFQKNEDAAVDKLFSFAPAAGIPLISGVYGRCWVDLNRHPLELDPDMFSDPLPPQAQTESGRVRVGFGVIPRLLNPLQPIYRQKLLFRVEQKRLFDIHFPYHDALKELIKKNIALFGKNLLLDVHSMPEFPKDKTIKGRTPDFVLGNGDGRTCAPEIISTVAEILRSMGFFVTLNLPYSGAYTTLYYGRPEHHCHALQIEIARSLYWNADRHMPSENFDALWRKMSVLIEHLLRAIPLLPM
jgi:N-formylglutamate amidohydrolase